MSLSILSRISLSTFSSNFLANNLPELTILSKSSIIRVLGGVSVPLLDQSMYRRLSFLISPLLYSPARMAQPRRGCAPLTRFPPYGTMAPRPRYQVLGVLGIARSEHAPGSTGGKPSKLICQSHLKLWILPCIKLWLKSDSIWLFRLSI